MPRKAVRELAAQFVRPPKLDSQIGDKVYRLQTEYHVWPLYFLHVLADLGGVIKIRPGRRWTLTPFGEDFPCNPPFNQLVFLLSVWWHETNWAIAYPRSGLGERLPFGFSKMTHSLLRKLPLDEDLDYAEFADKLISATGLKWKSESQTHERDFLHSAIRKMVIDVLADFDAVERRFERRTIGEDTPYPHTHNQLVKFSITALGDALLDGVGVTMVMAEKMNLLSDSARGRTMARQPLKLELNRPGFTEDSKL